MIINSQTPCFQKTRINQSPAFQGLFSAYVKVSPGLKTNLPKSAQSGIEQVMEYLNGIAKRNGITFNIRQADYNDINALHAPRIARNSIAIDAILKTRQPGILGFLKPRNKMLYTETIMKPLVSIPGHIKSTAKTAAEKVRFFSYC